jgi:hypothetical protein
MLAVFLFTTLSAASWSWPNLMFRIHLEQFSWVMLVRVWNYYLLPFGSVWEYMEPLLQVSYMPFSMEWALCLYFTACSSCCPQMFCAICMRSGVRKVHSIKKCMKFVVFKGYDIHILTILWINIDQHTDIFFFINSEKVQVCRVQNTKSWCGSCIFLWFRCKIPSSILV